MKFFSVMRSLALLVGNVGIVATLFLIIFIAHLGCRGEECLVFGFAFIPAFGLGILVAGLLLIIFIVSLSIFLIRRKGNFPELEKMQMRADMKFVSFAVFISILIIALELLSSVSIFKLLN